MANEWLRPELTWYRGSIRPYASLWSTLIRLGRLNRMRLCDLPDRPQSPYGIQNPRQTWYPLFNNYNHIDTEKLAHALGEPPQAFNWSHLGHISPWLWGYFSDRLRFCRACLKEGYHSSLYSLRLLHDCPIHGEALIDTCTCGVFVSNKQTSNDFRRYGKCSCPDWRFLALNNWRQPTIDCGSADKLAPLAQLLDQLATVTVPNNSIWGQLPLPSICASLDIAYPDSLSRPEGHVNFTINKGGPFPIQRNATSTLTRHGAMKYWSDSPATWTYRAICRFIRRHVISKRDRLCCGDAVPANFLETLQKVRSQPRFLAAYIEMRWAKSLESTVVERRWPYRRPDTGSATNVGYIGRLQLTGSPLELPKWCIRTSTSDWLEYHWTARAMLNQWLDAAEQSRSLLAGPPFEAIPQTPMLPSWSWSAQLLEGKICTFIERLHDRILAPKTQANSKQARVASREAGRQRLFNGVRQQCSGPCLTWSECDGWHVTLAYAPTLPGLKQHVLLGVSESKVAFWLYGCDGMFVTRLCSLRLQTSGKTPRQAIEQLRNCYKHHRKHLGMASNQ